MQYDLFSEPSAVYSALAAAQVAARNDLLDYGSIVVGNAAAPAVTAYLRRLFPAMVVTACDEYVQIDLER